ncbi:uncharacterized protein [Hetaerina americana]|uniref:uncharacterized protein n=1 Tax=Hetaerina americana TaxID=62018 RepID=UPI003A7F60B5
MESGCESGALLKQSNCIKESAFDGRPDKLVLRVSVGSRESNDVESEGAETAMQMKDSANQNEETRLLGDPAQLKSQGTLNKEDQGGHSDKFFMHVNMGAVVKEGRKAEVKEMRGKNWNKSNWTSHSQTGVLDRRRFTESDPVKKGEDMISLHSKYEVIESDKSNRISGDENFKGACITKARCSEMKRKHVHGIGRGVSVFKDWATLESMSTVMVGNESDNSGGAKSGSHFDEMKSLDASSKFCDQGFERQAYQESERCESSASECISPLSRNLRKLISLNEQQKQKDKVQTFVVKPIRKKEMSSVKEDISSVKAPTRNVSPSSENRRKLEAGDVQGRGNENEGVKKDIELHSGVLAKVSELPAATEIVKAKAHQEVNGNAASSKESPWNLFSGDPKTQIVNYDLCTQQKKLSSEVFSKTSLMCYRFGGFHSHVST